VAGKMKKRLLIAIPIIGLLVALIITSTVLVSRKPDTSRVSDAQKLAEYTKPAVVHILNYITTTWSYESTGNATYDQMLANFFEGLNYTNQIGAWGSGSIINSNGYIVTNAHVVEFSKLDDQTLANQSLENLADKFVQFYKTYYNGQISSDQAYNFLVSYVYYTKIDKTIKVFLPGVDIIDGKTMFDGEIKSYGAPTGEGKDVAVLKIEATNLPTLLIGDSSKVGLQDNVWAFGFPAAAESSALSPESISVVSVTSGKISAVDKKSNQGAPILQMDTPITHGNSGGPLVQEDGTMIGLSTFGGNPVYGQEVQGFNFAVPSNTVKEFVAQSGTTNVQGDVDRLYREGLDLYWGGYYKDALAKFEALQKLFPEHSEIATLITDSQSKISTSKVLWSKYKALFYTFDGLALIGIILCALYVFRGGKKKEAAEAVKEYASEKIQAEDAVKDSTKEKAVAEEAGNKIAEVKDKIDYELLKKHNISAEDIKDFNKDGKLDMDDVITLLEQRKSENTETEDTDKHDNQTENEPKDKS
jgi:S1-C subfamily serine protease